jgi:hypothetical protein
VERTRSFFIDPAKIGFFKGILESYEDVAIMTVIDGRAGRIDLVYPVFSEDTLEGIMADMERYGIQFREAPDDR